MWVLFSILTVLFWGTSDVVFKSVATDEPGGAAELLACNGIVLGLCGILYGLVAQIDFRPIALLYYLPIAAAYLASMVCYYNALPLIKLSIQSPVANCSCALVSILCVVVLKQTLTPIQAAAIVVMVTCMALLSRNRETEHARQKTYPLGILLALGYFLLDGIGSFLDDYILEGTLSADEVFVTYALIYGLLGLCCLLYLRRKQPGRPLVTHPRRIAGALLETGGQFTYVYAFAYGDAVLASPFIASFSAVSILFSRLFLREKLTKFQYVLVFFILCGMFILAIE
ncbi:MAG: DMT family transporter [Clostridiales bacterium]|nr:DMT family transporter [Clostridiales bacterium]